MAVTIHDVAKLAGVNSSTVSRVINGKATITPDTKERVYAAMRELDYHPNSLARSLASGLSERRAKPGRHHRSPDEGT